MEISEISKLEIKDLKDKIFVFLCERTFRTKPQEYQSKNKLSSKLQKLKSKNRCLKEF